MYAGIDFPDFEDGATKLLGFDLGLVLDLADGEIITALTSTLICIEGTDAALALDPDARFSGNASILGGPIMQGLVFDDAVGDLIGNAYAFGFYATTNLGQIFAPWAQFWIGEGYGIPIVPTAAPLANLTSFLIFPSFQKTVLSSLGDYAGQDFPMVDQGERWLYGFDLSPALSVGEHITSVTFALTLVSGTDTAVSNNPAARFIGPPVISGATVKQLTAWPQPLPDLTGNIYILNATARTSFNQSIPTWSRVAISSWL